MAIVNVRKAVATAGMTIVEARKPIVSTGTTVVGLRNGFDTAGITKETAGMSNVGVRNDGVSSLKYKSGSRASKHVEER